MAGLSPTPKQQIFGSDGAPLVGGKIYTYAAGTSTPATTYTDSSAGTANTNPIILDSYGQANIWLLSTVSYKFVVKTATDTLLYTVDNIATPLDVSALASPPPIGSTTPNTGAFTTLSASGAVTLTGLGAMKLNAGTTADRPTPSNGMIRYNTSFAAFEGYKGGAWGPVVGATVPSVLSLSTAAGALDITYSGTPLPVANGGTGLTSLATLQTPIGSFMYHTGSTVPTNYLEANGAAISRTTYAALYAVIGTVYGSGDGSTTFNVPDVRGYFVRGWDDGRGVDSGRAFGSNQVATHVAIINDARTTQQAATETRGDTISYTAEPAYTMTSYGNTAITSNTTAVGARPINIAFLPCIRYQ